MLKQHFKFYDITNFTPEEVEKTGADLGDIQVVLFINLQQFRTKINRRIHLLYNGLTTGIHKSEEHSQGLAVDFCLNKRDGTINTSTMVELGLSCLFAKIGAYYNQQTQMYSFHFAIPEDFVFEFWCGVKQYTKDPWIYFPMIQDPKYIDI